MESCVGWSVTRCPPPALWASRCGATAFIHARAGPCHAACRWQACLQLGFETAWTCQALLEPFRPGDELLSPAEWWLRLVPGFDEKEHRLQKERAEALERAQREVPPPPPCMLVEC